MKKALVVASLALLAMTAFLALRSNAAAQGGPPPPTSGTLLVSGLLNPQGSTVGPDGAIYVGEGGTGGEEEVTTPDGPVFPGLTGRISRIDPATGTRTTVIEGLPSVAFGEPGAGSGVVDVIFRGDTLYFLASTGGENTGLDEYPNGVYRVSGDSFTLFADIQEFNDDNPVAFPDAAPGGNPFAIDIRGTDFIVSDGNFNRVLRIDNGGNISILTSFENVVPTGLETGSGGPVYLTHLGPFPHTPETGKIVSIGVPSGSVTEVASGQSNMIDVELGPGGTLYGLSFADMADDPEAEPPPSGEVLRVTGSTMVPLVDGIAAATSLEIIGDTAYVLNLLGQVWEIEGLSSLQAIGGQPTPVPTTSGPAPTPTRATGVTAPDTGTGGYAGGDGSMGWLLPFMAAAGAAMLCTGAAVAMKRR